MLQRFPCLCFVIPFLKLSLSGPVLRNVPTDEPRLERKAVRRLPTRKHEQGVVLALVHFKVQHQGPVAVSLSSLLIVKLMSMHNGHEYPRLMIMLQQPDMQVLVSMSRKSSIGVFLPTITYIVISR